ncbi:MAG: tetratricopeptide repeat protein [Balneolaceae bacterium]
MNKLTDLKSGSGRDDKTRRKQLQNKRFRTHPAIASAEKEAMPQIYRLLISLGVCLLCVVFTAEEEVRSQDLQESPQEALQKGIQLFEDGLFAESVSWFDTVLESSDNRSARETAAFYRTQTSLKVDSLGAEAQIEWYVRQFPNSRHASEFLMDLGYAYQHQEEYREAIARFERALEFQMPQRKRVEVIYQMAESAAADRSYDLAREYYLRLADTYPGSEWAPKALYARGRLYLQEGDYSGSSEAFELLRERFPFDDMTRRIGTALGESYYQQGRFQDAIEAFDEAMPYLEGEHRSKAVYLTAESHNALNNLEESARYYRHYINQNRGADRARLAHYGLGWVFHKQEIYHWAAQSFGNAADGEDETARKALYYKAVNEKLAGRYDQALDTFREFGDRFSEGVFVEHAYYEWAVSAFEVGRYPEAIEVLLPLVRRVETLDEPGKVLTFIGEAYFANQEYTRALQSFELAEQLTDLDPALQRQARFQKAWVQYRNQAYSQAQPDFELVYRNSSDTELGGESLFWSADSYYQTRNYGPAAQQLSRFIREFPNHELVGAAKYALGWSYFMMGDYENAISPFEDFRINYEAPSIALFPYDTDTQLRIGDSYFALGRYEEALEYYNMTIGAEPGGDYAMFQVGNSYYRMNRNFEAVTEFRRLLRIYPYSSLREQAQYNVAYIYMNTGNYEQSIQEFRTVIERFPDTEWAARSQYNIGDAYYNAGEFEEAIEAYKTLLDRYPGSDYIIEAINGIQYAQLSAGGGDSSTEVLEEFLSDNPTSTTADRLRYRQAENHYQSGDYEGAVREFRQYIRITNSDNLLPDAYYNLADAYLRTHQTQEALESYETIIEEFPNSERAASALGELGRIKFEENELEESKQYFSRLLDYGSRYYHQAYLGMGNASLAMNRLEQALEEFKNALSASPGSDAAMLGRAKVFFRQDRFDEAREIFLEVAEGNSTDIGAEAQWMAGRTYQRQNRLDEALAAYSRVSVLFEAYDTWVAEADYKTAEIYILQGQRGDALNLLNNIIENYPGTGASEKARQLLRRE